MKFSKAHAYGNDFLYVASAEAAGRPPDALARELCDRHTGIGADGLILYAPAGDGAAIEDEADFEIAGTGNSNELLLFDLP